MNMPGVCVALRSPTRLASPAWFGRIRPKEQGKELAENIRWIDGRQFARCINGQGDVHWSRDAFVTKEAGPVFLE